MPPKKLPILNYIYINSLAGKGACSEAFRFDLSTINNTLIITPVLRDGVDHEPNNGRAFEKAFTRYDEEMAESDTHHRAILYNLGPLRCVVLTEVDAQCTADLDKSALGQDPNWVFPEDEKGNFYHTPTEYEKTEKQFSHQSTVETALFNSLAKTPPKISPLSLDYRTLHSFWNGKGTLSSCTAELVSSLKPSNAKKVPQMWLGRTPVSKLFNP